MVAPMVMAHAAKLEQVSEVAVFGNADVAARALRAVQALYDLDAIFTSAVDSVGWALRAVSGSGGVLAEVLAHQRRCERVPPGVDVDAVAHSPITIGVADLVERMRSLMGGVADVGVVIPTAQSLSDSTAGSLTLDEADAACGAFLRTVGAVAPDVVMRVGVGERGTVAQGTCAFFGIPLIEAGEVCTEGVSAPPGGDFVAKAPDGCWLYSSSSELPPDTDAKAIAAAVVRLRAASVRAGGE